MRKLNRSKPFGELHGIDRPFNDAARFIQDGLYFDNEGNELVHSKPAPVPVSAPKSNPVNTVKDEAPAPAKVEAPAPDEQPVTKPTLNPDDLVPTEVTKALSNVPKRSSTKVTL